MNKKMIVIYGSVYGTTKSYAYWIAKKFECEVIDVSKISSKHLSDYDIVVYGGGLYASGILGLNKLNNYSLKNLIIFTVGLANPDTTDYSEIINKNTKSITSTSLKIFHLRGGIDYSTLNIKHKAMMAALKKFVLDKKDVALHTSDDKVMLETYGDEVDFVDKDSIHSLSEYIKTL